MSKPANVFYNKIAFLYPAINVFLKAHKKMLIEEVNKEAAGNLLEIGVGNGSHLPLYALHSVTGIDISEAMLCKAHGYANDTVKLIVMDGEKMDFPAASFDYIVISHVLAVAGKPEDLLKESYRVLKPHGKLFILNHFTPGNGLKYIDMLFQPFAFLLHFRSVFYIEEINSFNLFSLVKQINLRPFSYFKILILKKP